MAESKKDNKNERIARNSRVVGGKKEVMPAHVKSNPKTGDGKDKENEHLRNFPREQKPGWHDHDSE